MTDILLPPWLNIARTTFTPIENTGVSRGRFGGPTRTASLGGDRMALSLDFTATGGVSDQLARRALISSLSQAGPSNRVNVTDPAHRINGSFPATELLLNNTFENGTTSWSNGGSNGVLSVSDRVMRVTRTSSDINPQIRQQATVTQYAPYASRAMLLSGLGSQSLFSYVEGSGIALQSAGPGIATAVIVAPGTTLDSVAYDGTGSGGLAGDYFEVPYMSLARCALVDAGVNLLVRSDEFDNASWTKSEATVSANAAVAPDGTSTADALVDNTNNTFHYVQQAATVAAAAQDFALSIAVKASARNFVLIQILTVSGSCFVWCNLTTGALTSLTIAGTSFSNGRATVRSMGNGWFHVCLVARKTSSETIVTARLYSSNSGSAGDYAGAGTSAIFLWRATLSTSGVPARLVQTTSAALSAGDELQRGSSMHLKGLPTSTNNLLLPGALIEIIAGGGSELKVLTAPVHSDASGLGYVQFKPAIRISPVDNAAVIIHQPFGRFIARQIPSWSNDPGVITTASAEFEEA